MSDDQAFIAMKVSALAVDPVSGVPMVILTDEIGGTPLPVSVGIGEAPAIAAELDAIDLERPLTHQLLGDLLTAAGARVARVELRDPDGGATTCDATVVIELSDGSAAQRGARASDALALALRCGAPIWVSVGLLQRAAREAGRWVADPDLFGADAPMTPDAPDADALLERLGPEAFGKWKM
ncbi:MAG TPA: bifunctional nuclease domain-containing protein [Kofleriaceae bacterium]|nr:bifunctional nuclease domain-containing protein [Kofleriaceae bacterium]